MFSLESTILSLINFVKRFVFTIFSTLFTPIKLIENIKNENFNPYVKPSVLFILILFVYYTFLTGPGSIVFSVDDLNYYLRYKYEKIFTFPNLWTIFIFISASILTYLILKAITYILFLKPFYRKLYMPIALYYLSVTLLIYIICHILLLAINASLGYNIFNYGNSKTSKFFSRIFQILQVGIPIGILLFSLFKQFYKSQKVILLKFLSVFLVLYACVNSYGAFFDALQSYYEREGEDQHIAFSSLESSNLHDGQMFSDDYIPIKIERSSNREFILTTFVLMTNHTNDKIYFGKDKCFYLLTEQDDEDFDYDCFNQCECNQYIKFKIKYTDNLLYSIPPDEREGFELYAKTDSITINRYALKDSVFKATLFYHQEVSDDVRPNTLMRIPEINQSNWKFIFGTN